MGYLARLTTGESSPVQLDSSPLGRGGEGSVYSVQGIELSGLPQANELVAKIYHDPTEGNRENKIAAMLKSQPESDSVAWPLASLSKDGEFVGYLMVKLPSETYRSWAELSNTKSRKQVSPDFDVRYAIVASENLGVAIKSIHDAGHCVGDVNESNILVASDSRIMIVDTDSAQIVDSDGTIFPCTVGKQEYTAPELTRGSFRDLNRTFESDIYAYGVAVFQMLTGGAHPTDAKYTGSDDPPSTVEKIRAGAYPGLVKTASELQVVPRIPVAAIPTVYKNVIKKSLSVNAEDRPSLERILGAEASTRANLEQCSVNPKHWFDKRDERCRWCEDAKKPGSVDPWGTRPAKPKTQQNSLPSLSFNEEDDEPVIRRAPVGGAPSRRAAAQQPPAQTPQPQVNPAANTGVSAPGFPPGFGSSQNSAGSNPQAQQQQSTPPPSKPNVPDKIKGKTVLHYADGTYGPRPPLGQMFTSNPKLAISCVFNEIPKPAKFWWSNNRAAAKPWAAIIGFVFGMAVSLAWLILIPQIQFQFDALKESNGAAAFLFCAGIVASVTASTAVLVLLSSAIINYFKRKKALPDGYKLTPENPFLVVLQFITVPIFAGPLFLILVFGLLFIAALKIVAAMFSSPSRSTRR